MLLDFRTLEDGVSIEADLCIIGAGAAGITIAREFVGSNVRVYLLESGGLEFNPDTQALYNGESVGLPYHLDTTRLRFFGGTTNHWEGFCGTLDEIDFQTRSWVPYSGWPITKADLDAYYEKAQTICNLGPYIYDERVWQLLEVQPLLFNSDRVEVGFLQKRDAPVRFGEAYREDLEITDNIRVLLHANAINIQISESGSTIEHVNTRTLGGKTGTVSAKYFILGCGGVENARLLLLSNQIEPNGVGNRNDLVGRFFMEHPDFVVGRLISEDPYSFLDTYLKAKAAGIGFIPYLRTGRKTQVREEVLNTRLKIRVIPKSESGTAAAREIYQNLKRGRPTDDLADKIWQIITDLDDVAWNSYRRFVLGKAPIPPIERVLIRAVTEQAPNPESRVTLSTHRDALGLNYSRLDWRLTDLEKRSLEAATKVVGIEFGRLGVGRVKIEDWLLNADSDWDPSIPSHHMGTTRMAENPKYGVVDKDCKVHGLANFYIAGSSVFPTSGNVNPTLTIVALALRLAEHIRIKLA